MKQVLIFPLKRGEGGGEEERKKEARNKLR